MLIFNTTFHTDDDVHDVYVDYMKCVYIPLCTNSGFLHSPRFARIRKQHEQDGVSYSLQFSVKNIDTLNYWLTNEGQALQQALTSKFGNKVAGFITVMDEIDIE